MAIKNWTARQRQRAQLDTITVGSFTTGHTFTVTVGTKAYTYVAVAADTTAALVATNLRTGLAALTDAEFTELTFTAGTVTATITVTGPTTGKPFTLAVGGTGTISTTTTTAPLSPNDWTDVVNWDSGSLPATGDTAVIDGRADVLYNLAGNNSDVFAVVRKATHTGRVGLPDTSTAGYPEYRAKYLELAGTSLTLDCGPSDAQQAVRVKSTAGSAVTLVSTGTGQAGLTFEPLEVYGLPASSVVEVIGGGAAIAVGGGQVATVGTLVAQGAAVRVGSGVTLGAATLRNASARIDASYTSLTMYEGGQVTVGGAASGSSGGTVVYGGTLYWASTGGPGNSPVVANGGTVDFSQAPGAVSVGGTVELNEGAGWNDPRGACGSYSVKLNRCGTARVNFNPGVNRTLAVS